jgi:hypothetical protein
LEYQTIEISQSIADKPIGASIAYRKSNFEKLERLKKTMTQLTPPTWHATMFGTRIVTMALVAFVLMFAQASTAHAQWGTSGTNIYNTNTGNVGIGTASPSKKLSVTTTVAGDGILVTSSAAGSGAAVDLTSTDTGGVTWRTQSLGNVAGRVGNFSLVQVGLNTAIEVQKTTLNIGIGTTSPDSKLVVSSNSSTLPPATGTARFADANGVQTTVFADSFATNPAFLVRRANGTAANPSAVQANELLGVIGASGYGTSAYSATRARVGFWASEIWTNSANGTYLTFNTTANGAATAGGTERMRIDNAGNVGIGTTAPAFVNGLDVSATQKVFNVTGSGSTRLSVTGSGGTTALDLIDSAAGANVKWANLNSGSGLFKIRALTDAGAVAFNLLTGDLTSGNVGIGTSPASGNKLDVYGNTNVTGNLNASGTINAVGGVNLNGTPITSSQWTTSGANISYTAANGNVGIGTAPGSGNKLDVNGNTNVTGNLNASGTITGGNIVAKYQDVAEWVESSQSLPAGTVVVLDQTKSNQVIASSRAYDTRVAGVVSGQPGITLGEKGDSKLLVATTGRVKVRVDATNGPIQVGDLLVTSDIAGVAEKSEPLMLGGVPIHRPGTLIGKALEPLARGRGEILVLLSLQ